MLYIYQCVFEYIYAFLDTEMCCLSLVFNVVNNFLFLDNFIICPENLFIHFCT